MTAKRRLSNNVGTDSGDEPKAKQQKIVVNDNLEMAKPISRPHSCDISANYGLVEVDNPRVPSDVYRSISPYVLVRMLEEYDESFAEKFMLVDCRYADEYAGGHIKCAVNVSNPDLLEGIFFPPNTADDIWTKRPIFYGEFSQKRGPAMAHKLRSLDSRLNELAYPHFKYNEIYLLDGGYNNFWSCGVYKSLCEPSAYMPMLDDSYEEDLANYDGNKKKAGRRSKILSRDKSLPSLNEDTMGTDEMHKATSLANVSVGSFDKTYEEDLANYDGNKKKAGRRSKILSRDKSLPSLNEDTMGTAEMHKATSLANVSVGSTRMNVKKRLDFDFD